VVLVLDAAYGLFLVVTHSLLLGQEDGGSTTGSPSFDQPADSSGGDHDSGWMLQLMDLDISWGHRLLGFDDKTCLVSGLIYGIIILLVCAYMFHAVFTGGHLLPGTTRWFVAFMTLQIFLYVFLVFVKYRKLCFIQDNFMPRLEMDCEVLKFMFLERAMVMVIIAGLCCWVVSSLAYFLAFGFQPIDKPEYAHHLEMHDVAHGDALPAASTRHVQGHSLGGSLGPSFHAPTMTRGVHGSVAPGAGTLRSLSYSSQAQAQHTSYHIPRASSAATSTTSGGQSQALIRPPIAIY